MRSEWWKRSDPRSFEKLFCVANKKIRNALLIQIKFIPLHRKKKLSYGVMVAHQFLALLVWVRILIGQLEDLLEKTVGVSSAVFFFLHTFTKSKSDIGWVYLLASASSSELNF